MPASMACGAQNALHTSLKPPGASRHAAAALSAPHRCMSGHRQRTRLSLRCRAEASTNRSEAGPSKAGVSWQHVMLALVDNNPYLSDSSKQATQMAAQLASSGRMTVLLVDAKEQDEHENVMRMNVLTEQLRGGGCSNFEVVDSVAPPNASATCGEVADQRGADLLVLSADAVHDKEFVPCPIMLLP